MANRQDLNARAFRLAAIVFRLYPRVAACGPHHAHAARELLRAASSIGSNLEEGTAPSSRRDMAAKYEIALRESREANYWARLLATDPKWTDELKFVVEETSEFVAMLTVSVRKLRKPPEKPEMGDDL